MILDEEIIASANRVRLSVSAASVAGSASSGAALALVRTDQGAGNHATNTQVFLGSGSYTFAWANVLQVTGANQTAVNPAAQNPVFQATVNAGVQSRANWRVTVTDTISGLTAQFTIDGVLDYTQTVGVFSATAAGTAPLTKTANSNSITSNPITATPAGATGAVSYLWSITAHNDPNSTPVINNPTAQSCSVTTNDPPNQQRTISVTVRCHATDAGSGQAVDTNTVTIAHSHDNGA